MLRLPNAARWGAAAKQLPVPLYRQAKTADPAGPAVSVCYQAKTAYSATIAPVGQAPSQAPQSMQAPASTTATPSSTFTAPTGQAPSQAPQPMHASVTLCAIVELSFRPVPPSNITGDSPPEVRSCTAAASLSFQGTPNRKPASRFCADCSKDKPKRQD